MLKRIIQKIKKRNNKENVDEVYEFFANGKSKDYKKAYDRALRMAQKDQMAILKKAELMK